MRPFLAARNNFRHTCGRRLQGNTWPILLGSSIVDQPYLLKITFLLTVYRAAPTLVSFSWSSMRLRSGMTSRRRSKAWLTSFIRSRSLALAVFRRYLVMRAARPLGSRTRPAFCHAQRTYVLGSRDTVYKPNRSMAKCAAAGDIFLFSTNGTHFSTTGKNNMYLNASQTRKL
jgi:hypothetical protein